MKSGNYVKNQSKILKQKEMNDSWGGGGVRSLLGMWKTGQVKNKKKPLLPFAWLHCWLLSSRDIRKHHRSTSFDWLRIKLRLEV